MKRTLLVCALAVLCTGTGGAQYPTTMHEDVLDGYNGSISLSLVIRTMIPRNSTIPADELWQHFHQAELPHFIEAYNATKSTLKNVGGVNARGCEVKRTDTIHIYFTWKDKLGKPSSSDVASDGDIVVSQTQVSGVGALVPAHRDLAAKQHESKGRKVDPRQMDDALVRSGLADAGPEHVQHIDWIWKVALKNSNYKWSSGTKVGDRYETSIQRFAGSDQDWRMSDVVVNGPKGESCSFTLGECGYFRLHRNKETKDGGGAEIRRLQRSLNRRCAIPVGDKAKNPRELPGGILQKK